MPKQPRWFKRPITMFKTYWGFTYTGEGVIYEREKSKKLGEDKVFYYVLWFEKDFPRLDKDATFMTQDMIRANVEIQNEFSSRFKRSIFNIAFKEFNEKGVGLSFTTLENFIAVLERNPEIKKYF